MRRKTDVNLREVRNGRPGDPVPPANHRPVTQAAEQAEAINSIQLAKKVARFLTANLATKVDKIESEVSKEKRFLIFEGKQTPIYVGFFERLLAELSERPSPIPTAEKEKVLASAPSKTLPAAAIPNLSLTNIRRELPQKAKVSERDQDVTPTNEPVESTSPSRPRSKKRSNQEAQPKPKGLSTSQVITLQNFHSIKNEVPQKSKEVSFKTDAAYPSGREFKRKDPLPIFRNVTRPPVISTPKGSDPADPKGFASHRVATNPSPERPENDLTRHRHLTIFASGQKNKMRGRRLTTLGVPQRFQSGIGKIREDVSENESEESEEDPFLGVPGRKPSFTKNSLQGMTRTFQMTPNAVASVTDLVRFTLNSEGTDENRLPSTGADQSEEPYRASDVGPRAAERSPELKLDRHVSDSLKKSQSLVNKPPRVVPLEIDHSIEEFHDPSPTQNLSLQFKKNTSGFIPKEAMGEEPKTTTSRNSGVDVGRLATSKSSSPPKSGRRKLRSADKDRMTSEIASIVRQVVDRALKTIAERAMYEMEMINREEERMRLEAKKAEKKIKKQLRDGLRTQIYQLMLKATPAGSKLPALFLASKHSESSLLIESVKKGIEKNLGAIELEVTEIYGQFEELRRLSPAELRAHFPFAISNLSIFTLKTIPEAEVKDVLTTDRLTTEMLAVFRLFYFIHFDVHDFVSILALPQKMLMTEIHDLYQRDLRHLEYGHKPLYRDLSFPEQLRLEEFLVNNRSLFSVISDMSLKPFFHSICFYTFEILFFYGMKSFVKFMEKPRERDKIVRNSAYQLAYLLQKVEALEVQKREFGALQKQFEIK